MTNFTFDSTCCEPKETKEIENEREAKVKSSVLTLEPEYAKRSILEKLNQIFKKNNCNKRMHDTSQKEKRDVENKDIANDRIGKERSV